MSAKPYRPVFITGTHIREYLICRRLPFMNKFRDHADQVAVPKLDARLEEGVQHEAAVAEANDWRSHVDIPAPREEMTTREKAAWTIDEMYKGTPRIAQGVLGSIDWWGAPDWLVRREGASRVGHWHYEVEDAKAGSKRRSKKFHILPVAFYSLILERIQRRPPRTMRLHREDGVQELDPYRYKDETLDVVAALEDILDREQDPTPHLTSGCARCPWQEACRRDAGQTLHLSQITGIRLETIRGLRSAGIHSLESLSRADADDIRHVHHLRKPDAARRAILQARAILDGEARLVGAPNVPRRSPIELYIDFENMGVTNKDDAFLFGLLVRSGRRVTYEPYLADGTSLAARRRAWNRFFARVRSFSLGVPIFTFGNLETQIIRAMAPERHYPLLMPPRLRDLSPLVQRHAALPVRGFGLKVVGKHLGATWKEDGAEGLDAQVWFQRWIQNGVRSARETLLRYNRDDLRATVLVRDWLGSVERVDVLRARGSSLF